MASKPKKTTPTYNTTKTKSVGVRLTHETLARLDAVRAKLGATDPRGAWTASDCVQVALGEWLARKESELGTTTPKKGTKKSAPTAAE